MSIFRHIARRTNDVWVLLGNGAGIVRVDALHVAVRLPDNRVTLAFWPTTIPPVVEEEETPAPAQTETLPPEGTVLLAEPMGNRPPLSEHLRIDLGSVPAVTATPPVEPEP